jgi:hypothetical protein
VYHFINNIDDGLKCPRNKYAGVYRGADSTIILLCLERVEQLSKFAKLYIIYTVCLLLYMDKHISVRPHLFTFILRIWNLINRIGYVLECDIPPLSKVII